MIKSHPILAGLLTVALSLSGCNAGQRTDGQNQSQKKDTMTVTTNKDPETNEAPISGVFFKASGNEPFWNISLDGRQMRFTSLIEGLDSITVPLPEVQRAADANVKMYRAKTESVTLSLTIAQGTCADTMADKEYPYGVTLQIERASSEEPLTLKGCGAYQTDQRLHDIWVLEQWGEEQADASWFRSQLPDMEINTTENSFMGFAGCNRMRGRIFWESGVLRFTDIATTRMACGPENREAEFLEKLRAATSYRIENNRLWLSNPNGIMLVFRKVD